MAGGLRREPQDRRSMTSDPERPTKVASRKHSIFSLTSEIARATTFGMEARCVQTGHNTCTCTVTLCVIEPRSHKKNRIGFLTHFPRRQNSNSNLLNSSQNGRNRSNWFPATWWSGFSDSMIFSQQFCRAVCDWEYELFTLFGRSCVLDIESSRVDFRRLHILSSILDHDFGHLCRGRRIQMSGHSDFWNFR